jgi:hypothetical protein
VLSSGNATATWPQQKVCKMSKTKIVQTPDGAQCVPVEYLRSRLEKIGPRSVKLIKEWCDLREEYLREAFERFAQYGETDEGMTFDDFTYSCSETFRIDLTNSFESLGRYRAQADLGFAWTGVLRGIKAEINSMRKAQEQLAA